MKFAIVDFSQSKIVYNFSSCTRSELENKLNLFFVSEGYKQNKQKADGIVFDKGNRVLRILLGAFVSYHRIFVGIKEEPASYTVELRRESSGMSGGLIGMRQVRKEFSRLTEAFRTYFQLPGSN